VGHGCSVAPGCQASRLVKGVLVRLGLCGIRSIPLRNQLARIRLTGLLGLGVALSVVVAVYAVSLGAGLPPSYMTNDPATAFHARFYVGILSNLGVMVWSAATSVCSLGALLLRRSSRQATLFLASSAALSLFLTLDDALQLHELVFPRHLHIPENAMYLAYVVVIAGYLLYFSRRILMTDYLLLFVAVLFLGLALVGGLRPFAVIGVFARDSLKFCGIVFWLAYYYRATSMMIRTGLVVG
jgi:hypothetical protein